MEASRAAAAALAEAVEQHVLALSGLTTADREEFGQPATYTVTPIYLPRQQPARLVRLVSSSISFLRLSAHPQDAGGGAPSTESSVSWPPSRSQVEGNDAAVMDRETYPVASV
jgi:hypothetical protein